VKASKIEGNDVYSTANAVLPMMLRIPYSTLESVPPKFLVDSSVAGAGA